MSSNEKVREALKEKKPLSPERRKELAKRHAEIMVLIRQLVSNVTINGCDLVRVSGPFADVAEVEKDKLFLRQLRETAIEKDYTIYELLDFSNLQARTYVVCFSSACLSPTLALGLPERVKLVEEICEEQEKENANIEQIVERDDNWDPHGKDD